VQEYNIKQSIHRNREEETCLTVKRVTHLVAEKCIEESSVMVLWTSMFSLLPSSLSRAISIAEEGKSFHPSPGRVFTPAMAEKSNL